MQRALLLLVLVPMISAIVTVALPSDRRLIRWWALGASLLTAVVAILMAVNFDWTGGPEIRYPAPRAIADGTGGGSGAGGTRDAGGGLQVPQQQGGAFY